MKILIILLAIVLSNEVSSDWKLRKQKSGVEIFTRSVEGSSFDEFKGKTFIEDASLIQVLEVVLDVENYESLFPDCENPEILEKDGRWHNIHYVQVKAPWPVKSRDTIYEQNTEFSGNGKQARVQLKPLPDYLEKKKEFVRIQKGTGFWELTEIDDNKVEVIYQFHGEPGGEIPAWLANSFVVSHPFQTLKNLKKRVQAN